MGFDPRKLQGWELHGKQSTNAMGIDQVTSSLLPMGVPHVQQFSHVSVSFHKFPLLRLLSFHHRFESRVACTALMSGCRRYGDATHKSAESRASVPRSNFCVVVKL